jgi:hypothetical protein
MKEYSFTTLPRILLLIGLNVLAFLADFKAENENELLSFSGWCGIVFTNFLWLVLNSHLNLAAKSKNDLLP